MEAREGGREPEGSQALDGGKKARFGRMGSSRHPVTSRLGFGAHLVRLLLACSLVGLAVGLPGEAPWGNTWSDAGGVLATSFAPLSLFYTCTVRNTTYSTMSACNAACDMGETQSPLPPYMHTSARSAKLTGAISSLWGYTLTQPGAVYARTHHSILAYPTIPLIWNQIGAKSTSPPHRATTLHPTKISPCCVHSTSLLHLSLPLPHIPS